MGFIFSFFIWLDKKTMPDVPGCVSLVTLYLQHPLYGILELFSSPEPCRNRSMLLVIS